MRLSLPRAHYDRLSQIEQNRQLEASDAENHKRGRDVEVSPARLIIKSPDGTRWSITVSNAGAVSAVAV